MRSNFNVVNNNIKKEMRKLLFKKGHQITKILIKKNYKKTQPNLITLKYFSNGYLFSQISKYFLQLSKILWKFTQYTLMTY